MPIEELNSDNGTRILPNDVLGHLLLVWATEYIAHSPTKYTVEGKPSDVIVVDVVDLDQQGLTGFNCWWRPSRLIMNLRPKIGKKDPVLVKITREIASNGAPGPYEITSWSSDPQAVARANAWFQANPNFQPSTPQASRSPQTSGPEPRDTQSAQPPEWAQPLPSEPNGPAWLPAQETWPGQAEAARQPYQPPAPARPLTQAERMAADRSQHGY